MGQVQAWAHDIGRWAHINVKLLHFNSGQPAIHSEKKRTSILEYTCYVAKILLL